MSFLYKRFFSTALKAILLCLFSITTFNTHAEEMSSMMPQKDGDGMSALFYSDGSAHNYRHSHWWIAGISTAAIMAASSDARHEYKRGFGASMAFGGASEYGLREYHILENSRWARVALAAGLGVIPGLLRDVARNDFDKNDLASYTVGSFMGAVLSDFIQGPIEAGPQYGVAIGLDQVGLVFNYVF